MPPSSRKEESDGEAEPGAPVVWLRDLPDRAVTIIVTLPKFIDNLFRMSDPLKADTGFEPSVSSFEAYKATYERGRNPPAEVIGSRAAPTDAELRKSYEALKADRLERNRFEARRSVVSQALLLVLALGLFFGHWRWLRHMGTG